MFITVEPKLNLPISCPFFKKKYFLFFVLEYSHLFTLLQNTLLIFSCQIVSIFPTITVPTKTCAIFPILVSKIQINLSFSHKMLGDFLKLFIFTEKNFPGMYIIFFRNPSNGIYTL